MHYSRPSGDSLHCYCVTSSSAVRQQAIRPMVYQVCYTAYKTAESFNSPNLIGMTAHSAQSNPFSPSIAAACLHPYGYA